MDHRISRSPITARTSVMRQPSADEIRLMQRRLLDWFKKNGRTFPWRKPGATLYQLVLPEILLQRTRAEVVAQFIPSFMRAYPSWASLAATDEATLGKYLKPLGLWRRRSESLLRLARYMAGRRGRFPRDRERIEELPGIGQYIANAICLFALKQSHPLLDVNMARVLERCFGPRKLADIRYDPSLQDVARAFVASPHSIRLNWAILDLAALICTRTNPRCAACPLLALCAEGQRRAHAARAAEH